MIFRIDPASDQPLYLQLGAQVHVALARGELHPGDRLPPARELAGLLDLNMHTVLHAYQQLRDDGVIELRRGRGAVVIQAAPEGIDDVRAALRAFVAAVRAAGLTTEAATALVKHELNAPT